MFGIHSFGSYLLAAIVLNLTPGNDTIFILGRSIASGRKAGAVAALGIATGSVIHTLLAAFGISLIIARSLLLFTVVKYIGAAYLIFIGIRMLLTRVSPELGQSPQAAISFLQIYRDAVLTNVMNPKVALFFIAFLPQFVDPAFHHPAIPLIILGLCFTTTGTPWCLALSWFAAAISLQLRRNKRFGRYLNRICGGILIALGIRIALAKRA